MRGITGGRKLVNPIIINALFPLYFPVNPYCLGPNPMYMRTPASAIVTCGHEELEK
jgi:hypothetical protein